MDRKLGIFLSLLVWLSAPVSCHAGQVIVSKKVADAPVIDGSGADNAWARATEYVTYDAVAKIDMTLKTVYTDAAIYFLVGYPDADKSVTHKTWEWDKDTQMYRTGRDREDVFVFKWNMESYPVDLSLKSGDNYLADIWFWKACRSDPAGYADDKFDRVSAVAMPKSSVFTAGNGKTMYMLREGDKGLPASQDTLYGEYKEDKLPGFTRSIPTESRADIKAKGAWVDGRWTIEFGRALDTGYYDDVQFDTTKTYLFGVSRYEIAGRAPDPALTQPLYGCGDVSEALTLKFSE